MAGLDHVGQAKHAQGQLRDGVANRLGGLLHVLRGERTACARLVLNQDALTQRLGGGLGQRAQCQVVALESRKTATLKDEIV